MSSREQCTHVGFINAPFGGEVMPKFEVARNGKDDIVVFDIDQFDNTPTDTVLAEFTSVDDGHVKADIYSTAVGPEVVSIAGDLLDKETPELELHAAREEDALTDHVRSVAGALGRRSLFGRIQIA